MRPLQDVLVGQAWRIVCVVCVGIVPKSLPELQTSRLFTQLSCSLFSTKSNLRGSLQRAEPPPTRYSLYKRFIMAIPMDGANRFFDGRVGAPQPYVPGPFVAVSGANINKPVQKQGHGFVTAVRKGLVGLMVVYSNERYSIGQTVWVETD